MCWEIYIRNRLWYGFIRYSHKAYTIHREIGQYFSTPTPGARDISMWVCGRGQCGAGRGAVRAVHGGASTLERVHHGSRGEPALEHDKVGERQPPQGTPGGARRAYDGFSPTFWLARHRWHLELPVGGQGRDEDFTASGRPAMGGWRRPRPTI